MRDFVGGKSPALSVPWVSSSVKWERRSGHGGTPKGARKIKETLIESDLKIPAHCGRPTDVPGSQLPVAGGKRFLSFPRKICDRLQALGVASRVHIGTGPPSPIHIPLLTPVGGVRDPGQGITFPSRVCLLPAQPSAPKARSLGRWMCFQGPVA